METKSTQKMKYIKHIGNVVEYGPKAHVPTYGCGPYYNFPFPVSTT